MVGAMTLTRSRVIDALVVVAVLVSGLGEVWVPFDSRQGDGNLAWTTVQVVVIAIALWWRRVQPLRTLAVVLACFVLPELVTTGFLLFFGSFVPICIAVYSAARHGVGRQPWLAAALTAAAFVYGDLFIELLGGVTEMLYHWGVLLACFAVGRRQAVLARRAEESQRQAIRAEVEAAERAAQAVLEERTRIARELHDIVAHAMSAMVVQAGAAEQVVDEDHERVRSALKAIRETGAEALGEMRRLVAVLRDDNDLGLLAPQPGLSGLARLVDDARRSGLPVELTVAGEERDLPTGVDLAAYRIVQEALTNARRHACAATSVTVDLRFAADRLDLEIRDDGTARAVTAGSGHGLIGMRERVALYGGTLQTGPLPERGFLVHATLPLAAPAVPTTVPPRRSASPSPTGGGPT